MRSVISDEKFGQIVYEESAWTGRKSIYVNGKPLSKITKNTYFLSDGEMKANFVVQGNYLKGSKLLIEGREIQVTPPVKWYEVALSVFIFALVLVWGNTPLALYVLPVVGGAIGGLISGAFMILNLFIIKQVKNIGLKILISLGLCAVSFLICMGIGFAIVGALHDSRLFPVVGKIGTDIGTGTHEETRIFGNLPRKAGTNRHL